MPALAPSQPSAGPAAPAKLRGADALVAGLLEAGITRVFTLSGNHIMPVFDAALDSGLALIHTRHEASTVHMADAWARLTGQVGVALVTGGPGHANAISALYTATMAESPVLLLSGHAPLNELGMGAFQEMRQADLAAPLCKASWTVESPETMAADLARALKLAASGRPGPVHLSLPVDVLEGACPPEAMRAPPPVAPPSQAQVSAPAQQTLELLKQAKRPLILAGPACMHAAMRGRLHALQTALGVPVIGMESPRGIQDPALGEFPGLLARADLIVLLGKRLDFTLKFGAWPGIDAACRFIQFDAETQELERNRRQLGQRLLLAALSGPAQAIDALLAGAAGAPLHAAWTEEVQAGLARRAAPNAGLAGAMHPLQALAPLQEILSSHPQAVLVCDGGEIGQWAQAALSAPYRVINGVAGAIGAGIPFALAASMAHPGAPVVAVMGDGSFGFHCSEIDTAVRCALPVLLVVGNDARWNAEYQIQLRQYGPQRLNGCTLLPTSYEQVAIGFGGHGELVTEAEQVLPAAQRALASGLPACLNLMVQGLPAPAFAVPAPVRKGAA